uniref:UBC core domain-containing protein n=1 Tax=Solanum lycopersicum TaxID=4081 RepID=A0A3Q7IIK2_SOLLC
MVTWSSRFSLFSEILSIDDFGWGMQLLLIEFDEHVLQLVADYFTSLNLKEILALLKENMAYIPEKSLLRLGYAFLHSYFYGKLVHFKLAFLDVDNVYHPNIDLEGNVCLNILREDWKPVLNINTIIYGLYHLCCRILLLQKVHFLGTNTEKKLKCSSM